MACIVHSILSSVSAIAVQQVPYINNQKLLTDVLGQDKNLSAIETNPATIEKLLKILITLHTNNYI